LATTFLNVIKEFFVQFMQPESRIFLAFIAAQILSAYSIPIIVSISKAKSLTSTPNHRTSHQNEIPTIGGLAIFSTLLIISLTFINISGFSFLRENTTMPALPSIIAGITILFFIGMKDDLLGISWQKKLAGQITAMLILSVIGDQRITNMQGVLGIHEIIYPVSILISVFIGVALINSFNLIDGIDGLASLTTIIASFTFGLNFYLAGDKEYAILCAVIIGTLMPFFYYNVWGTRNKLFMGDTGSLILGFLMTALAIHFNRIFFTPNGEYIKSVAAMSIGILFIPIFDTLRVFTLRIISGDSPFHPDKRHIHHMLLDLDLSHLQASLIIGAANVLIIVIGFSLAGIGKIRLLLVYFLTAIVLVSIPTYILKKRQKLQKAGK